MANNNIQDGILNPGQVIKPHMNESDVFNLVKHIFGLDVLNLKELKSYDDKNYLVKVGSDSMSNHYLDEVSTDGYVLKVMNSLDSKDTGLVDAQNHMMLFLKERGFKVPTPVKTLNGSYKSLEFLANKDSPHVVRLLHYLPGKMLFDVPYTAALFYEIGEYIAKMDNALEDFKNDSINERNFLWMLSSVPQLSNFTYVLKEEWKITLINEVLSKWNSNVAPKSSIFRKGIIHGDINEQNILVTPDTKDQSKYHLDGLIDFGDISHSCYVFELAIAITYMMIEVKSMPPLDVGGHLLAGYLPHRSLSDDEWMVLKDCISGRFAQSLVLGAYSYEQDPGNEYLLTTAASGWKILKQFWEVPSNQVICRWKEIILSYDKV